MPAITHLVESLAARDTTILTRRDDQSPFPASAYVAIAVTAAVVVPSALLLGMFIAEHLTRRRERQKALAESAAEAAAEAETK
ncbi:hypothetical protein QBC47DRAFT_408299 [Echria macrotheca]|uniref:Uncharacterized protein n=1 Tax=Echria macrotheca TaxID=438768 RepID=A0AAJ0BL02_9PEZI|nr:hypothetical protein QBC47DRAFT_408299 [Echria macrotheca]